MAGRNRQADQGRAKGHALICRPTMEGVRFGGPFFYAHIYLNTGDSNEARRAILSGSILNTGDSFERGRAIPAGAINRGDLFLAIYLVDNVTGLD